MSDQTTGWISLGSSTLLPMNDIPANCARHFEIQYFPPAGANNSTQEFYFELVYDETTMPLTRLVSLHSGGGIIPERFDISSRRFMSGVPVTASGGQTVSVPERLYCYGTTLGPGVFLEPPHVVTLNQTSGNGALAAGESYIAVLSQALNSDTTTTTKGNKGTSPVAPATPTDHLFIAKVTITYQAGGTSVINQGNVDQAGIQLGEYALYAGSGLNVIIAPGHGITTTDHEPRNTSTSSLALTDNAVNIIWLFPDGTFLKTTTANRPADGVIKLGSVTTAGGVITAINTNSLPETTDRAITEHVMTLKYLGALSAGVTLCDWDVVPFNAFLVSVDVRVGFLGSGSGSHVVDINRWTTSNPFSGAPTTLYQAQGAGWDQRPALGVADVFNTFTKHEIRSFSRGDAISFDIDAVTSTPGTDITVQLHFVRA